MPKWMLEVIKAEHPEAFGHNAHWDQCPKCGALVLVGADWTEDWCYVATVDPAGLDTMTELAALVSGRRTFEVIVRDTTKTLRSRDQWRIGAHTPESVTDPVVPAHRCGQPLGTPIHPKQFVQQRTQS